jgi:hypothetical protein
MVSKVVKAISELGMTVVSICIFLGGFVLIALYTFSESGSHLRYLSVGLLTATAAFLTGSLGGLILGVPRKVSSGELRLRKDMGDNPPEPSPGATSAQKDFEPSTNLAEISDWLTKLLLGAGLVSLSRLGRPLSQLINTVARGLGGAAPNGTVTESAAVIAATILIAYFILGFLDGYLTTTLWYGKRLGKAA